MGVGGLPCKMAGHPTSSASLLICQVRPWGSDRLSVRAPPTLRPHAWCRKGGTPYLMSWGAADWLLGSPEMERCWALPETEEKGSVVNLVRKAGWVGTFGPGHLGDLSFPNYPVNQCYFHSETTTVLH